MIPHWLQQASDLIQSEVSDLKALAVLAGSDPTTFYRGADLSKTDLSGQDLRGLDFTGANLNGAIIDDLTKIDPGFYPYDDEEGIVKHVRLSPTLMEAVKSYCAEVNYAYTGSALKSLIETAAIHSILPVETYWEKLIVDNPYFLSATDSSPPDSYYYRVNVRRRIFRFIRRLQKVSATHHDAYAKAILIGLLVRKLPNKRKDYSTLPLTALYPRISVD